MSAPEECGRFRLNFIYAGHVQCRAWALASLAPTKDMEVVVIGSSLDCADFQLLLFVGLRTLIERLGAAAFNVGIFNISLDASGAESSEAAPVLARYASASSGWCLRRRVLLLLVQESICHDKGPAPFERFECARSVDF